MRAHLLFVLMFATNFALAQNIPGLPPTLFPSIVSPTNPRDSDEVFLRISGRGCIGFLNNILDFQPTIVNSVITVQIRGEVAVDSMFCFYPLDAGQFSLGRFPAGTYSIELRFRTGFTPITELGLIVQRTPLVVGPEPFTVTQVPGNRPIGLAVLALSLVLLGSVFVRRVG